MNSERILVMVVIAGLGIEAWRGWATSPTTPLPPPWLFTAYLVVVAIVSVIATFSVPLAAVLLAGVLVALLLGANNPLLASTGPAGGSGLSGPAAKAGAGGGGGGGGSW